MPLTVVDIVILVIVLASALMALLRGFLQEMLTIVAWVTAAVAMFLFMKFFGQFLRPAARAILNPPMLADIVSFAIIFIAFLIPALSLAGRAGRRFGRDDPGVVDRMGGFVFGVARGLFIIGLVYWPSQMLMKPGGPQGWLENARLKPIIVAVASIFPQDISALITSSQNRSETDSRQLEPETDPSTNDNKSNKGYGQTDRLGLDQLITTTNED